jgi:hypothetical protein
MRVSNHDYPQERPPRNQLEIICRKPLRYHQAYPLEPRQIPAFYSKQPHSNHHERSVPHLIKHMRALLALCTAIEGALTFSMTRCVDVKNISYGELDKARSGRDNGGWVWRNRVGTACNGEDVCWVGIWRRRPCNGRLGGVRIASQICK